MERSVSLLGKRFQRFLPEAEVLQAVQKIADEIARDYKDEVPVFVGVLNGAFMFVSDFLKCYPYP